MKNLFRSVMYAKKRGQSLVEISIVLFLLLVVVVGVITHYNQQHAGKVADVAVQMSNDRSREQGTAVSVSGADTAANNTDPEATSTPMPFPHDIPTVGSIGGSQGVSGGQQNQTRQQHHQQQVELMYQKLADGTWSETPVHTSQVNSGTTGGKMQVIKLTSADHPDT